MAIDNNITIVGNIVRDPELRFLNSGQAVVGVSVAVNRRWKNKQTDQFEEKVSYFEVSAFGELAENVANSLVKGNRVVVSGSLEQRSYETDQGEKRSVVEIKADEVSPSLKWATVSVIRTPRPENSGGYSAPQQPTYDYPEAEF